MKRYQEILIGIRDPEIDAPMLDYVCAITKFAGTKRIHLLHVDKTSTTVDDPITEEVLGELAEKHLKGKAVGEVVCKVVQGAPALEILAYANKKSVDLIVIGGDGSDPNREAGLGRRVTRKAICSVLILPKAAQPKLSRILVPVRDTACSEQAVETAIDIAAPTESTVIVLNVFQVHSGITRANLTLEEYIEQEKQLAQKQCESLLSRVDSKGANIEILCVPDPYGQAVERFLEVAREKDVQLIVIGARGRSGLAGVLLADVTEKLIRQSPVPLLASKKKGEILGILGALMTITQQEA